MQKISEDSKNSHLKFSSSLKSNVKNSSSHLLNSKNLIFSSQIRARGHAPGLQGCNWWGRPPVVEVEAPQVKSWAKQNNFIFLNKSHYWHWYSKKRKFEHAINNQHILDDWAKQKSQKNKAKLIHVDLHRGRSAPHPWPPCAGRRTGAWPQPGAQHTDVADGAQVGKKSWKIWMDTMKTWEKWTFSSKGWKRQSCQKSYKRVKECWGAWFLDQIFTQRDIIWLLDFCGLHIE